MADMDEQEYFKRALSDFTYEAASGGAIRHLTDLGYTVQQICEQLSFPTPYARVQHTVWKQLVETGIILTEEPGSGTGRKQGKNEYAMERDKYGRTSFRLIAAKEEDEKPVCWRDKHFGERGHNASVRDLRAGNPGARYHKSVDSRQLAIYLTQKCDENDGEAYISCRFGLIQRRDPAAYTELIALLNERQREYLTGLPWEEKICYHRLDRRMQEIAVRLYAAGKLEEICFFMKSAERVSFIL